jgi:hypothetical protein
VIVDGSMFLNCREREIIVGWEARVSWLLKGVGNALFVTFAAGMDTR